AKVEQHFRATRNPALLAQWETLADRGERKKLRVKAPRGGDADRSSEVLVDELARAGSVREAHEYIVSMLATWARAQEAHLYAWTGTDLRLVSSFGSGEPPSS